MVRGLISCHMRWLQHLLSNLPSCGVGSTGIFIISSVGIVLLNRTTRLALCHTAHVLPSKVHVCTDTGSGANSVSFFTAYHAPAELAALVDACAFSQLLHTSTVV